MPVFKISTNIAVPAKEVLLQTCSRFISDTLGKPESYVMVEIEDSRSMLFGGSNEPLALVHLISLGLPKEKTKSLSESICSFIEENLGIQASRIYIHFESPERTMFGWNNTTF